MVSLDAGTASAWLEPSTSRWLSFSTGLDQQLRLVEPVATFSHFPRSPLRRSLTSCGITPDALSHPAGNSRALCHILWVIPGRSLTSCGKTPDALSCGR